MAKEKNLKQSGVRVPPELHDGVAEWCDREGVSLTRAYSGALFLFLRVQDGIKRAAIRGDAGELSDLLVPLELGALRKSLEQGFAEFEKRRSAKGQ